MVRRSANSGASDSSAASVAKAPAPAPAAGPKLVASPFSLTGVQRKVKVGSPGDSAEHEANRVADQVTGGSSSTKPTISRLEVMQRKPPDTEHVTQHKEEAQTAPAKDSETVAKKEDSAPHPETVAKKEENTPTAVNRSAPESKHEEAGVQRAEMHESKSDAPAQRCCCETERPEPRPSGTASVYCKPAHDQSAPSTEVELNHSVRRKAAVEEKPHAGMDAAATHAISTKDAGVPLRPHVLQKLESRMGADLSGVRVHEGPAAQQSAAALQARAFTHKGDIWLGRGESQDNLNLMAHEATHVVQQGAAARRSADAPRHDEDDKPVVRRSLWDKVTGVAGAVWDATAGKMVDAAGNAIAMGADFFWKIVQTVAPAWIIDIVQAIRAKGIIGYLKDKLSGAFNSIFSGLSSGGGFIPVLMQTFTKLLGTAHEVIGALGRGDCKPLFAAMSRLGDVLSQMAGDAWEKIKEFFAPVGDFFADLWKKFGAPVVDFLGQVAADVWNDIKALGQKLWDGTQPVRDALAAAWKWIKDQLGIGEGPEGQNGLLQWVQTKLGEAWDWVKEKLQPIIGPMKALVEKIKSILPLDAILNLRQTVHDWLHHASQMITSMRNPKGVTQDQEKLRSQILPAVKGAIVALGGKIASAGGWVSSQIGGIAQTVTGLFSSLRSNPILGKLSGAIQWVQDKVSALAGWVQGGVVGLFNTIGSGVAKLAEFVEPVLNVLKKIVSVIANVVKELPGLVLGPLWKAIPACIRDPIKDFIIEHILSAIPIISTFLKVPEIWSKIQKFVMDFLATVFVNGDLAGAAVMVIRFVLEAAGVNVDLMLSVLAKAADSLDQIIMKPVQFLGNLAAAVGQGLKQFVSNIGRHLLTGLVNWLVGPLKDLGIEPIRDLSLTSIFGLVMGVLGITQAKLRAKAEKAVGPKAVKVLEGAWKWIKALITGGIGGLWTEIKTQLSDLGGMILGGISQWITVEIVEAAVAKLIKLCNPAGAIIEAIQTIYKTITFLVQKANEIIAMVDAVLNSIQGIVAGNIGAAAGWIEQALARTIPAVLAFFAKWVGIGDPAPKVREIVLKIQGKVEAALDWLVDKAIAMGKKLMDALGLGKKEDKSGEPAGDYIYEEPDTGGHVFKVRADLKVFRFSDDPVPVTGAAAQKVEQDALEKVVKRTPPTYPTDSLTRAVGPSGHVPTVKEGEERENLPSMGSLPGGAPTYQPGDHRGHLIGDRFGGAPVGGNLVPMHPTLNLSTFKTFENTCASEYKSLKDTDRAVLLYMRVVPSYPKSDPADPASYRPKSVSANAKTITLKPGSSPAPLEKAVPGGGSFDNPDSGFVRPDPVNLSTDPLDAIASVNGIGPVLALRIVKERKKNGPFWEYANLQKRVDGIGAATFAKLQADPLVRIR